MTRYSGMTITSWAFFGVAVAVVPAMAQDRGEVTVDVERCLDLETAAAREACFAAQVNEVLQQRSQNETDGVTQSRASNRESGNDAPATAETRRAREAESDYENGTEYFGTVVEVREYKPSAHIIRLDNGQVWEQTEPKEYPLRIGLEVRIYPTRWGSSYRLTALGSRGRHIQVRRVQ